MKRQEKIDLVLKYQTEFASRPNVFLAEYRGMTVEQITDLRVKLRKADGAMKVMKNTFLRRAVDGTDKAALAAVSKGPNAVILANSDFVELVKVLTATDKEIEAFKLKGGVVFGKAITPAEIREIALLPPRNRAPRARRGQPGQPAARLLDRVPGQCPQAGLRA